MSNFFGSIYGLFQDFYGLELSSYLWGVASPLSTSNSYIAIGLTTLGISLVMVLLFYYIVDKPRLNNWWGWMIFMSANAVINFIVAYQWVIRDFYANKMIAFNPATGIVVPLNIGTQEITCFGLSNMILSVVPFFLLSMICKWRSLNCPNAPF